MTALHAVAAEAGKPAASVVYVSPEIAARWLRRNTHNRGVNRRLVAMYARDMTAGNWSFTGEPIIFSPDGTLLDGQHRLAAIVASGVTLGLLIVRNITADAQRNMDSGRKRTVADWLAMEGGTNTRAKAALARVALIMTRGPGLGAQVSHAEILDWLDAHPAADDAVTNALTYHRAGLNASPASLSYAWLLISAVDRAACIEFFHTTAHGMTDGPGDPRHALFRRFVVARQNKEYMGYEAEVSLIVRAWNAWRKGTTVSFLRVRTTQAGTVAIPKAL